MKWFFWICGSETRWELRNRYQAGRSFLHCAQELHNLTQFNHSAVYQKEQFFPLKCNERWVRWDWKWISLKWFGQVFYHLKPFWQGVRIQQAFAQLVIVCHPLLSFNLKWWKCLFSCLLLSYCIWKIALFILKQGESRDTSLIQAFCTPCWQWIKNFVTVILLCFYSFITFVMFPLPLCILFRIRLGYKSPG